ncbi:MAG: HAMP domain-containing histidine kinase [Myxococcales bacterium]|nr:HAMP domain-containing histidine kinase [Myxococcales bacterium]
MKASRLHLAVGRLRTRVVLAAGALMAVVAALCWAIDRYGLALSPRDTSLQLWALLLFATIWLVPMALYSRSALGAVGELLKRLRSAADDAADDADDADDDAGDRDARPDDDHDETGALEAHDEETQLLETAREAALRFPTGFVLLGLSLFAAMLPVKLLVDIVYFELPTQLALALLARLTAFGLACAVVFYMLLRVWTRPLLAHLPREAVPKGIAVSVRARVVFALVALSLIASVPTMMLGSATTAASVGGAGRDEPDDPALRSAAGDRQRLARVLAHGAAFAGPDALREQVAALKAPLHVFFSRRPGKGGIALPSDPHGAVYLRVERGDRTDSEGPPREMAVLLLLVALLVGLAAYLASDIGWTLERDVQYISASVSALADEAATAGAEPADDAAPATPDASAPLAPASLQFAELRELAGAVNHLLERMAEMHVAHYVAVEKTLEADQLRTQFLANMSHDLRSPLNSILGFTELLLTGHDGDLADAQRETLLTMQNAGRHLLRLIDSVLDAAKLEAGRYVIHREPVPATTLLNKALELAEAAADRSAAKVSSELQAGMPVLEVDARRLAEAIARVVVYCRAGCASDGHVALRLGVKRPTRSGSGSRDDTSHGTNGSDEERRELPRLWFEVTDTSRDSVPAEAAEELFVGFRRRKGRRGLGLDLPLARAVVERHGGSLTLQPREDAEGNRFYAELPLEQRRAIGRLRPVQV